jgi:hypothetical protein
MGEDFLAPVLAKFVTADFTQWFIPIAIPSWDRARALEKSWEDSYRSTAGVGTLSESFSALMDVRRAGQVPLLLLNSTHVETGRRYIMTPLIDRDLFLDATYVQAALKGSELRVSTAAHNSARFTYVSPAGRIERHDGNAYGALVDGGYFENSGLTTLHELFDGLQALIASDTSRRPPVHIVVLYLCNDPLPCKGDLRESPELESERNSAGEWFAPVRALLAARNARGGLARKEIGRAVPNDFIQLNVCDSLRPAVPARRDSASLDTFTTNATRRKARDRLINPPLGWLLSAQARRWMDSSLIRTATAETSCPARNVEQLERIASLLRKAPQ